MPFRPPRFPGASAQVPRAQKIANTISEKRKKAEEESGTSIPPQATQHTEMYTYFTKPSIRSSLIYSADQWVTVRLTLETAGPVAVGTLQEIGPVLSGKGTLLPTGEEREIQLAKGDRLYEVASSVNRVTVTTYPVPYLKRLVMLSERFLHLFKRVR